MQCNLSRRGTQTIVTGDTLKEMLAKCKYLEDKGWEATGRYWVHPLYEGPIQYKIRMRNLNK